MVEKNSQYPEIPKIPESLKRRLLSPIGNNVVIFFGNGVSRLAGIPSWEELGNKLLDFIFYDKQYIRYNVYCELQKVPPKEKLSIVYETIKRKEKQDYEEILQKKITKLIAPSIDKKTLFKELYKYLSYFDTSYITTNYSSGLLDLKKHNFTEFDNPGNFKDGDIAYIHGEITDNNFNNLVLTVEQYLNTYKKNSTINKFLEYIFKTRTVLFIGLGFQEYEMIQYLIDTDALSKEPRHYILYSYSNNLETIKEEYKNFYKGLSIELIAYNISDIGYIKLKNVLKNWSEEIQKEKNITKKENILATKKMNIINKITNETSFDKNIFNKFINDIEVLKFFFVNFDNPNYLQPLFEYKNGIFFELPFVFKKEDVYKLGFVPLLYINKIIQKYQNEDYIYTTLNFIKKITNKFKTITIDEKNINEINSLLFYLTNIISTIDIKYIDNTIIGCLETFLSLNMDISIENQVVNILNKFIEEHNCEKVKKLITVIINFISKNTNSKKEFYFFSKFISDLKNINKIYSCIDDEFILFLCGILFRTVNNRNEYLVEETSFFIKITKESKNTANIYVIKDSKEYKYKVKSCFSSYKAYNKNILFKRLKKEWNSIDISLIKQVVIGYYYLWKDFSYISYKSLYGNMEFDYKGNLEFDYRENEEILIFLLKELLLLKARECSVQEFNTFFNNIYIHFRTTIFERILLYCYGKEFEKYRDNLFDIFKKYFPILFIRETCKAEIYYAIKNNAIKFTDKELLQINNLFQKFPYSNTTFFSDKFIEYMSKNKELVFKSWQKEWYSTLVDIPKFKEKYISINVEKEFLNFRDSGVKWIEHKSPFSETDIIEYFSKQDLSAFYNALSNFEQKSKELSLRDKVFGEKPSLRGLYENLETVSKKEPTIIISKLKYLKNNDIELITNILYGLTNINDKKKYGDFNWTEILSFISKYLETFEITNEEDKETKNKKDWLLKVYLLILERYIENNQNISDCYNIIVLMYSKIKNYSENIDARNYKDHYYSIFGALLEFILKIYEINKSLDVTLKEIYDELMNRNIPSLYYFFGLNFDKFLSLDKDDTMNKANYVYNNINCWKPFFHGFCNVSIINIKFYDMLKNHYLKAISDINNDSIDFDIVCSFAYVIAYIFLYSNISIENFYLITTSLSSNRLDILTQVNLNLKYIINDILKIDKNIKEYREKIQKYMLYFYSKYKNDESVYTNLNLNKFLTSFLKIFPFISYLDPNTTEMINLSISCITNNFEIFDIFEQLYELYKFLETEQQNMKEVSKSIASIYIAILNKNSYYFDSNKQKEILKLLKKYECYEEINKIRKQYIILDNTSLNHFFKSLDTN